MTTAQPTIRNSLYVNILPPPATRISDTPIIYCRNETNIGCGLSRKKGLNLANGDYIVFADDDDLYTDFEFFAKAETFLNQHPDVSFYGANVNFMHTASNSISKRKMEFVGYFDGHLFLSQLMQKNGKPQSTFTSVFRKESLIKAGLSNIAMVNDAAIYMRAALRGNVYLSDDVIGLYRIHQNNISCNLSSKFIIDNIEEAKAIYEQSKMMSIPLDMDWLKREFIIKSDYYFSNNKYNIADLIALYRWGKRSRLSNIKYFIKYLMPLLGINLR